MIDPQQIAARLGEGDPTMYEKHYAISGFECILLAFRGSIAHGTYEPNTDPQSIDDIDLMGIAVPSAEYYLGLSQWGSRGTKEIVDDPWDIVVYEARKALTLLLKANPNVLSLLWLPEEMYVFKDRAGDLLLENRHLFATKAAFNPFVGYARGQMMKMERKVFEGYMGAKRKRLVEQYGYDTKNAAHMIRILRMGIEFLNTGEMRVDRRGKDADELLAIKHGEVPLEKIKKSAEFLFRLAEAARDRSSLPEKPDRKAIEQLCVDIVSMSAAELPV